MDDLEMFELEDQFKKLEAEGREALNPYTWIDKTVLDHRPEPVRPIPTGEIVKIEQVTHNTADYRSIPGLRLDDMLTP